MFRMPSSYYDPPEPTPVPLKCMLCGMQCLDKELRVDELPEDGDYSICPCPNMVCGEAGGLYVDGFDVNEYVLSDEDDGSMEWFVAHCEGYI